MISYIKMLQHIILVLEVSISSISNNMRRITIDANISFVEVKLYHLGGVINKLVIYFQVLMDQLNVIIRTRKDKSCRYNGYIVKILNELLQYPHLRYGKIMNHTLFEEPKDGSGMNKTFNNLKKGT